MVHVLVMQANGVMLKLPETSNQQWHLNAHVGLVGLLAHSHDQLLFCIR